MRARIRFSLKTLLLVPAVVSIVLVGLWWWPKSQPLSINEAFYTGYYRGFGLTDDGGVLGKQFFRLVIDDGNHGYWEVDYSQPGFNPYRGFYPNGVCREEGECFVEINGGALDPAPDSNDVQSGKYYKPNGTLGSEVADGTGKQTLWYLDGTKRWELVLRDHERVRHSMWYQNGQLRQTQNYLNDAVHGEFESFHENGAISLRGAYIEGNRVGVWSRFDEKGHVESIEDYSGSPAKTVTP